MNSSYLHQLILGVNKQYIRNGLEFNRIWDNMNKILEKCPE